MSKSSLSVHDQNKSGQLAHYTTLSAELGIQLGFKTIRHHVADIMHSDRIVFLKVISAFNLILTADKTSLIASLIDSGRVLYTISGYFDFAKQKITSDRNYLVAKKGLSQMVVIEIKTGKILWSSDLLSEIYDYTISENHQKVLVATSEKVFFLDLLSGKTEISKSIQVLKYGVFKTADPNHIVLATQTGHTLVLHIATGKTVIERLYFNSTRNSFDFNEETGLACIQGDKGSVVLLNYFTNELLHKFYYHEKYSMKVKILPQFNYIITQGADSDLVVWDMKTYQKIKTFNNLVSMRPFELSPDEKIMVYQHNEKNILQFIDLQTLSLIDEPPDKHGNYSLAFTSDSRFLISSQSVLMGNSKMFIYDFKTGKNIKLGEFEYQSHNVAVSEDNQFAAVALKNCQTLIYDLKNKQWVEHPRRNYSEEAIKFKDIKNKPIAAIIKKDAVLIWDKHQLEIIFQFRFEYIHLSGTIRAQKNGEHVAFSTYKETVIYSCIENKIVRRFEKAKVVDFHPSANEIAICYPDRIEIVNTRGWKTIYSKENSPTNNIKYSATGDRLLANGDIHQRVINIFSNDLSQTFYKFNTSGYKCYFLTFHSYLDLFLWNTGSFNYQLISLNPYNGQLNEMNIKAEKIMFSAHQSIAYMRTDREKIIKYDLINKITINTFSINNMILHISVSENDEMLAMSIYDGDVKVIDTENFSELATLNENEVKSLSFLYDDRILMVSKLNTMVYYDTSTWKPVAVQYIINKNFVIHTVDDQTTDVWYHTDKENLINIFKSNENLSEYEFIEDETETKKQILSTLLSKEKLINRLMYPEKYRKEVKAGLKARLQTAADHALENKNIEKKFLK